MQKTKSNLSDDQKTNELIDWENRKDILVGWTRDGGVQDQIDASIEDAVKLARKPVA